MSANVIAKSVRIGLALAGTITVCAAAPVSAVDSYHDYYEYYAHYGAGYDNQTYDDDWFYDYYEFKADANASAFDGDLKDFDYDADAFIWEERGIFD